MGLLEQWGVPLAVLGMLLATLLMASVVSLYQAHRAQVGVQMRRLESGANELSNALESLRNVPLSREMRLTLRGDILARNQKIRRLYRRYPGIAERISAAEHALNVEGPRSGGGVGPIDNEQVFRRIVAALDTLIAVMEHGGTLRAIPADVRVIFHRELGERRAEVLARHHLVQSRRYENDGQIGRARSHLTTLLNTLRRRGPSTEFVRELYAEADAALNALNGREIAKMSGEPAAVA